MTWTQTDTAAGRYDVYETWVDSDTQATLRVHLISKDGYDNDCEWLIKEISLSLEGAIVTVEGTFDNYDAVLAKAQSCLQILTQ